MIAALNFVCTHPRYMAPESFLSKRFSEATDVYGFAILLWELMTFEINALA